MTSMTSVFRAHAQTRRVPLEKVHGPADAAPGYVAVPASLLKLVFGLLLIIALVVLLVFGLSFLQTRSFDHDLNTKNAEITSLETRLTNTGTRLVQIQAQLDALIARNK